MTGVPDLDAGSTHVYLRRAPTAAEKFEIVDAKSRRRLLVEKSLVLALASEQPDQVHKAWDALRLNGVEVLDHGPDSGSWFGDAWTIPAMYLHASQRAEFHDSGDEYRNAQEEALNSYRRGEPIPVADSLISGSVAHEISRTTLPSTSIGECFLNRRTPTKLSGRLQFDVMQQLLWYGFSYPRSHRHPEETDDFREYFNSLGSAFDVLVAVADVEGVRPGWYWYDLTDSSLLRAEAEPEDAVRDRLDTLTNRQGTALGCAAAVILVARLDRYRWRYRHDRALRNVFVEAGRLGQNLALIASGHHVDSWFAAPLAEDAIGHLLGRDSLDDDVMYAVLFGGNESQ